MCFKYCILCGLYHEEIVKNPQELYHYKRLDEKYSRRINFYGIRFPVKTEDISKFEKQNPDISVNVYQYISRDIYLHRISEFKAVNHFNLLIIGENNW